MPLDMRQLTSVVQSLQARWAPDGLELQLVNDAAIARLNSEFMGCQGATNVLTFPGATGLPGSIVISLDCLARECLLYSQEPKLHFLRLLSHGFGHLAGLDHGSQMQAIEDACFALATNLLQGSDS